MTEKIRQVKDQVEFDAALAAGEVPEIISSAWFDISKATTVRTAESSQPHVVARESSQPHVVARESSQPHVEAWGSSQPHVEAWESSQPHVVARESSQPHVVAWESSQPHVVAWGSSQPHVVARESSQPHVVARGSSQPHVEAWGSSQPHVVARESSQPHVVAWGFCQVAAETYERAALAVKAGPKVAVLATGAGVSVDGGGYVVRRERPATGAEWCEYYGIPVNKDGIVILYKAVDDDWRGSHKTAITYKPGDLPVAPDWDPVPECGGGLHFSPHPVMALRFCSTAVHYIACPVAVAEIVAHPNGQYPEKCKAPRVAAPVYEVTIDGDRIGPAPEPAPIKKARKKAAA